MLKLIATNGQRSLFQTGFANLWEGTDLEETVPTGHVVDEEGVVIPVKNIYAMFRDDSWEIIDAPDEPLGKGRKRQFASRAEAARYAARIRWGTTTPDANASAASNGVPMEPTDDVNEAITTGAPFKPLLFESLPPDIQEGLTKTETSSLPFNDEMVLEAKLTAYYAKVLSPDSISPENQYEIGKYGSHYRQFVNSGTSADPLRADERLQLASSMARQTVIRHREKQFLIGREDEALKETKDLVSQPEMKIAMTVTESGASAILTGGRITTQFETKTSRGALNPQGRAAHEAVAYGTHPATIPDRRPVYATLHPVGVQHPIATGAEQYGTIQFVMKPQVSDRSTFSVVDSLGQNRNPSPVRGPITRGQAHPYTKFPKDAPIHPSDKVGKIRRGDRTEYSEAQIHGGVRLSDVAYIVANRRTSDLVERAAKHGIPVISIGTEPRDRTGKMKILPEPAEVAKSVMMRLIATDGERSLYQTGFTTLRAGTPLEETFPSGHVIDELGEEIPVLNIYSMFSQPWDIIAEPLEPLEKGRQKQFGSRSEAAQYAARIRWGTRGADATSRNDALDALPPPTMDVNVAIATGAPYIPLTFEGMPPHIQEGLIALENGSMVIDSKDAQSDYSRLHRDLNAHYMEHLDADGFSPETIKILESRGFDTDQTNANSKSVSDSFSFMGLFEPSKITPPNQPSDEVDNSFAYNLRQANSRASFANQMANATMMRHMEIRQAGRSAEAIADTKLLVASPMKRIALARSEGTAVTILETGRITTQFETKKSAGALGLQTRAVHEAASFGIHPLAEPSRRPIYASLHPLGVQHSAANGSSQYGTVQFVMKPQVAARSTFTNFDSLKNVHAASPVNGRITSGQLRVRNDKSSPADSKEWLGEVSQGKTVRYAEAQIHGGIKLSEISHIAFSGTTPSKALVAAARKRGIPIVVLGDGTDGKGKFKIFPDPIDVAKSSTVDITDTIGRIWEAVDSLVVEKGRKRKFSTRTEAAQYAARIRWGTTSGSSTTEKPHMKAMREEAEALRVEVSALNQTVSFDNMQRSSTKAANGVYAWSDAKGDIQVNTANEELIPSPKVADIHDRVLVLGGKMESEAMSRTEAQIAAGKISTKEEMRAAYAKNMQDVVAEVRPCGGKIEIGRKDDATAFKTDSTSQEAFDAVVPNLELVGKVMPTDWSDSTKGGRLMIRSDDKLPNGHFVTPNNSFDTPIIAIPTLDTQRKRGELDNLRVVGHETQHYITYKRPAIQALEVAFITHRTTAFTESRFWKDESRALSLRERMKTKPRDKRRGATTTSGDVIEIDTDMFANAYSGRRYDKAVKRTGPYGMFDNSKTRFTAFELMTTGFEQVLSGNADNFDRDHLSFALGVMATA